MSLRIQSTSVLGIPISPDSGAGNPAAERIQAFIEASTVLLFVKGTAARPACGFSATVVDIFNRLGVPFATFDVLADPEIRSGAKAYSEWPTFPQIYVGGELVGGCDIAVQLYESGELEEIVKESVTAKGPGALHQADASPEPAAAPSSSTTSTLAKGEGSAEARLLSPRKLSLMGLEHFVCVEVDDALTGLSAPHTVHLPLAQIGTRFEELPTDANLLFVDSSGDNARHAAEFLVAKGYRHVYHLEGGVAAWRDAAN